MIVYLSLTAPHSWVHVDKNGRADAHGVADTLAEVPIPEKATRVIGAVPGEEVVIHSVSIPVRGQKKLQAAVPYALEDRLAADIDDLFFAILDQGRDGTVRVAVIENARMTRWLTAAQELTRRVDQLVPDYALVPLHPQAAYTVAVTAEQKVCIRGRDQQGLCMDRDDMELWWTELNNNSASVAVNDMDLARLFVKNGGHLINQWEIGTTLHDWLRYGTPATDDFNLLQGKYRSTGSDWFRSPLAIAAGVMLLSALLLRLSFDGYQYFTLRAAETRLNAALAKTLQDAFPGARAQAPGTERVDMASRLERLQTGAGDAEFQALLAATAKAVSTARIPNTKLESISFRNNELIVTCSTASFDGLNRLQAALTKSPGVQVALTSSSSLDNKVTGRFNLKRKS